MIAEVAIASMPERQLVHSQPPKLARRNALRVAWQMAARMRLDLLLLVTLCGLVLVAKQQMSVKRLEFIDGSGLSMLGIAVSIFVAFRNTQAINRWWEARVLWGAITNCSRHWRDTLRTLIGDDDRLLLQQQRLVALHVLQCWLLNFELRGFWRRDARELVSELSHSLGLADSVRLDQTMALRADLIGGLYRDDAINDWGRDALLRGTEAFTNALGGLQRIRNTPLPPTYDVFIRLICWLYGYALFLSFTHQGLVFTGLVLFLGFVTAERIGAYVEGPFDQDGSSFCVPMDVVCRTISTDLLGPGHGLAGLPLSNDPSQWS
jgi:ion channel-forming bestrophin family protein